MPQTLSGTPSWLDTVTAPVNGDSLTAESLVTALQTLLNQATYLKNLKAPLASPVFTGWPMGVIPRYASVATLQAISGQPDTALARIQGGAVDLGIYEYQATLIAVSDGVNVIRPTSVASDAAAGRWVSEGRGLRGIANGFAGLDAGGFQTSTAAGCTVKCTADLAGVPAWGWGYVAFAAEDFDTDNMHDNATNNSRVTIRRAGLYLCQAHLSLQVAQGAGNWYTLVVVQNQSGRWASQTIDMSKPVPVSVAMVVQCAAGDYLELGINNGTAMTMTYATNGVRFTVARLG